MATFHENLKQSFANFKSKYIKSNAAASGGTDLSMVTTGEKYTWNNKSNLALGTTATTAAKGNHTHTVSIATDSGTNQLTMAANTKYKLTAGGSTYIFTTPPDNNTNNAVTQTATTGSANYEVLFSSTADNTTRTEGARKNGNLLFNPSTGNLQATQLNGVTIGSSPKFTDTNTWRGIQNNLTSTSTTESLSAYQGKLLNDAISSINTNLSAKQYVVSGTIANGIGTTFSGLGVATVHLLKGGIAIIEYEYTITALNKTGVFTYGLNRDLLKNLNSNIPTITPVIGGICHVHGKLTGNFNGATVTIRPILDSLIGYAGLNAVNAQFWQPARIYNTSGSIGGWPDNAGFNTNDIIEGIAIGTY